MKTTYTIENLTNSTVGVKIVVEDKGKKKKYRRSYCNSDYDRAELQNILSEEQFSSIIDKWGNAAAIPNLEYPRIIESEDEK